MGPSAKVSTEKPVDLLKQLRSKEYLLRAWLAIRANGIASPSDKTRAEIREFERDLPGRLRSIRERLRSGYKFSRQVGRAIPKDKKNPGKGKRPLVIAALADRVVQRAILEVLYDATQFTNIQTVLTQPTSAGGLKDRNVDYAISLIQEKYEEGAAEFICGSDISGFFTRIDVDDVVNFVRAEINDEAFADLFAAGLAVDLSNRAELSEGDLAMFPTPGIGVAQGCPLSALAGNIALRDFDKELNGRGVTCIRYIDDFAIIGRTKTSVDRAFKKAKRILSSKRMTIYDPVLHPGKAFSGKIGDDLEFLGYKILPGLYPPATKNQKNLLRRVDDVIRDAKLVIRKGARGKWDLRRDRYYAQALAEIDKSISAWNKSFKSARCAKSTVRLDNELTQRVVDFVDFHYNHTRALTRPERRKLVGVSLLADAAVKSGR